jgi:hypothetical protein
MRSRHCFRAAAVTFSLYLASLGPHGLALAETPTVAEPAAADGELVRRGRDGSTRTIQLDATVLAGPAPTIDLELIERGAPQNAGLRLVFKDATDLADGLYVVATMQPVTRRMELTLARASERDASTGWVELAQRADRVDGEFVFPDLGVNGNFVVTP